MITHSSAANCHGWERSLIFTNSWLDQKSVLASAYVRCICLFDTQIGTLIIVFYNLNMLIEKYGN